MNARGQRRQRRDDLRVNLARVSLPGDGVRRFESKRGRDSFLQLLDFGMIVVEKRKKRRLCSGSPFNTTELQRGDAIFEFLKIQHQIVRPQTRALADSGELRRLKVRVG